MSFSGRLPTDLTVRSVQFYNGTNLGEENIFSGNVSIRKRLRVESDLSVNGKISYVDNQTGWGLPQWTYASSNYNKTTDSLIAKLKVIQDTYATKQYVDSQVFGSEFPGLTYYETSTYPKYDTPTSTYPIPITTLAANTGFIIRDSNENAMNFYFQKGSVQVGKVLGCLDTDGTVGWVTPSNTTTQSDTIQSTNGQSNTFTFRVIDVGSSGNSATRGFYFYPNISNNSFNKSLFTNDFALLGGIYQTPTTSNLRMFVGPTSYGYEGISFVSTYQTLVNSVLTTYPGKTTISGSDSTQKMTLESDGIKITPSPSQIVLVDIPNVAKNLATNTWRRPFAVRTISAKDEYPTFMTLKTDITDPNINRAVMINPYLTGSNFNNIVKNGDIGIISADVSDFFNDGVSSVYNEVDYGFVICPWSAYYDGIRIRPTLQLEETTSPLPMTSGYTRLTAKYEQTYLEINRNGITSCLNSTSSTFSHYGPFRILNKTGAILNNTNTSSLISSFQVGTTSSVVSSSFYGETSIGFGDLYLQPFGGPLVTGYFLQCMSTAGKAVWSPLPTDYSSLTTGSLTITGATLTNSLSVQNSSTFQSGFTAGGSVTLSGQIYINSNPALNKVLGCTNATTGKAEWITLEQASLPTDATFTNLTVSNSATVGSLTANYSSSFGSILTCNGDVYYNQLMYIASNRALNKVFACTDGNSGRGEWVNLSQAMLPSSASFTSLTCTQNFSITNNFITQYSSQESYFTNLFDVNHLFTRFSTDPNSTDIPSYPIYPNRATIYYFTTESKTIGNFTTNDPKYVYLISLPARFYCNWSYRDNKQSNDELVYMWFETTSYKISLKNLSTNQITNLPEYIYDIKPCSYFCNDRYLPPYDDSSNTTGWKISMPLNVINIEFQGLPNATYEIYIEYKGRWINQGEYVKITEIQYKTNYNYTSGNPYQLYVSPNGPYNVSISQYTILNTSAIFNLNPSGNSSFPYYYPQANKTQNVIKNVAPYDDSKFLAIGNLVVRNLQIEDNIYMTKGNIYACGMAGRQGMPNITSEFPYSIKGAYNSLSSWGSIFNFYWTTSSKYQIWVDYTLIYEGSANYSDYRIKENLREMPSVLNRLSSIQMYMFDFKPYEVMQPSYNKIGFLAHEVKETFPDIPHLVQNEKDEIDNNGKMKLQTIDEKELLMLSIKAIQELKAENEKMKLQIQELFTMVQSLLPR